MHPFRLIWVAFFAPSAPFGQKNSPPQLNIAAGYFYRVHRQTAKNEMTLDCFIYRSESFFTNSVHPQSRVISARSWYLASFCVPLFHWLDSAFLRCFPFSVRSVFTAYFRLPLTLIHLVCIFPLSGIWVTSSLVGTAFLVCDYIIHPAFLFVNLIFTYSFHSFWYSGHHLSISVIKALQNIEIPMSPNQVEALFIIHSLLQMICHCFRSR